MTDIICYRDSYLKEFDATVTAVAEKGIVLDRTAFYPGGGGQPPDSGAIYARDREYRVKRISRDKGAYVHEIDGEDTLEIGTPVHGILDWDRRYQLMRTHTALHILCGVVWRDYGAQVTGGNMTPLRARMDFELESMSADFAERIEKLINAEVAAARDILVSELPREEAFQTPDLIRTKINLLPPQINKVRIVDIEGLDLQADGGTHVANTSEVGRIRVTGHESKGRVNKRLRIEVEK